MKRISWMLLGLLLLSPSLWAAATVEQRASGFGATPQQATANALVNAARQALGVALTLDPEFRQQTMTWVVRQSDKGNVITQRWSDAPQARLPTRAGIKSYRVESLSKEGELWKAEISARLARSQSLRPERDKLPSLVVLPFQTQAVSYALSQPVTAAELRDAWRQALVSHFTQSRQVRVLDRRHQAARGSELAQAAASLQPTESAKLGKNLGADLLLTGRIDIFRLGLPEQTGYGGGHHSLALHVLMHYRLIDVASGDILSAASFSYQPAVARLQAALSAAGISAQREPLRFRQLLYAQAASSLVNQVLNRLAPLQVLKVVDRNHVYISGGQGRLQPGDSLAVASIVALEPPKGIKVEARQLGKTRLRVVQAEAGYALAKVTAGSATRLAIGTGLMRLAASKVAAPRETHPMTPGSSSAPIQW